MSEVADLLRPLLHQPCWGAKRGHGSFLTFEFGAPQGRHGEWHLWITGCVWLIARRVELLAHAESPDELVDEALAALEGRALSSVTLMPDGHTEFRFGADLSLMTLAGTDTGKWLLYPPGGPVLELREDGAWSTEPGPEEAWTPLYGALVVERFDA